MDSDDLEFWVSILKKLSTTTEEVLKLRKEVARAQKEADHFRDISQQIERQEEQKRATITKGLEDARKSFLSTVDRLKQDSKRAYDQVAQQLNARDSELRALKAENVNLQHLIQDASVTQDSALHPHAKAKQYDMQGVQAALEEVPTRQEALSHLSHETRNRSTDLEARVGLLSDSLNEREQEIEELQRQITALSGQERENRKLRHTIGNHEELIERLKTELGAILQKPRSHIKNRPSSQSLTTKAENPCDYGMKPDAEEEDITPVNGISPQHPSYATPITESRLKALEGLPQMVPGMDIYKRDTFRRAFLSSVLGGSSQPLIVKVTSSATALSQQRGVSCYLCPNFEHNPWCPSTRGQHGYMFVGLGQERDTFTHSDNFNLFLGIKQTDSSSRHFTYLGIYSALRVDPLSVIEWNTLSADVKRTYSKTTKSKEKDPRSDSQIEAAYDLGELRVPCVRLQCVDFDEELYAQLSAAEGQSISAGTNASSMIKRRRGDDEEYQSPARKRFIA